MWDVSTNHIIQGYDCSNLQFRGTLQIPQGWKVKCHFNIVLRTNIVENLDSVKLFENSKCQGFILKQKTYTCMFRKNTIPKICQFLSLYLSSYLLFFPSPIFPQLIILVASTCQMSKARPQFGLTKLDQSVQLKYNIVNKMFCLV